jgi:hypothetical protein
MEDDSGYLRVESGVVGDRAGDFASAILQIAPTGTALVLALSSGMGKESAQDTIFHWFEDSHQAGRTTIASGGTTNTLNVGDGSQYVPNQVGLIEDTGELVLVTAIVGNALTVVRGLGGTAIVAVSNVMHFQSVGNAHEEASPMPTAITQQGSPRFNYTQIFRNAWAISGTAKAVKYNSGSRLAKNKRDCALYHAEDMERAMIFGRKHVSSINNKPFRLTDGIQSQIEQYDGLVEDVTDGTTAGSYSWLLFDDFMRRLFSTNIKGQPNERLAIGGNLWLAGLSQMARLDGNYQIFQGEDKLGIKVTSIENAFGTLKLMSHPLFNENPFWNQDLMLLHPGGIKRRVLRETFEEGYDSDGKRIQAVDADEGVITSEFGVQVGGASVMGILRGFKKAVKSDPAQLA